MNQIIHRDKNDRFTYEFYSIALVINIASCYMTYHRARQFDVNAYS